MKRYFSLILLASNAVHAHELSLEQSIDYAKDIVSIIQAHQEEQYEMDKIIMPDIIDALTNVASPDAQPHMDANVARVVIDAVLDHHGLADQIVIDHVFQEITAPFAAPHTEPIANPIIIDTITDAEEETTTDAIVIDPATVDIFNAVSTGNVAEVKQALENNPEEIFKKDAAGKTAYQRALQSHRSHKKAVTDELLEAALRNANNECPVCLSTGEEIKQDSKNGLDVANANCMHFVCKSCKKDLARSHASCPLCRKPLK